MSFLIWLISALVISFLNLGVGVWYVILSAWWWSFSDGDCTSGGGFGGSGGGGYSSPDFSNGLYDRIYEDGKTRVNGQAGFCYYSDGTESYTGMFGEEHRENGEIVYDNAYFGIRDIYKDGELVGHEYEDGAGITHRY